MPGKSVPPHEDAVPDHELDAQDYPTPTFDRLPPTEQDAIDELIGDLFDD